MKGDFASTCILAYFSHRTTLSSRILQHYVAPNWTPNAPKSLFYRHIPPVALSTSSVTLPEACSDSNASALVPGRTQFGHLSMHIMPLQPHSLIGKDEALPNRREYWCQEPVAFRDADVDICVHSHLCRRTCDRWLGQTQEECTMEFGFRTIAGRDGGTNDS